MSGQVVTARIICRDADTAEKTQQVLDLLLPQLLDLGIAMYGESNIGAIYSLADLTATDLQRLGQRVHELFPPHPCRICDKQFDDHPTEHCAHWA